MEPKPVQQPRSPIWFGAREPAALRRAARLGDGWIGGGVSSAAQFREHVQIVKEALAADGRGDDEFPIGKRLYVAVEEDVETARSKLAAVLDRMYGHPGLTERVAAYGPPERCAEAVEELVDAGAGYVLLNPLYDYLAQLDALAKMAELS